MWQGFGQRADKFKASRLTLAQRKMVNAPLIKEFAAHLECKLVHKVTFDKNILYIGEGVEASVENGVFVNDEFDMGKIRLVLH